MLARFLIFSLLTILIQIIALQSWAYDPDACWDAISDPRFKGLFISSTQVTSSFGPCSLFARNARKAFLAANNDSLKQDIAKGSGEHLEALSELYGCKNSQPLNSTLQQNLNRLISPQGELDFKATNDLANSQCKKQSG